MKNFLVVLTVLILTATVASAELLVTANPVGKGKWAFSLAAVQDSNVFNTSAYSMMTLGGYAGYGITEKLDLFLNLGSGTVNGIASPGKYGVTSIGLNGKYCIVEEGNGMPVSVALGLGYKTLSFSYNLGGGDTTASGSQIMAGVGVSKIMAPFVPYGGLAYRTTTSNSVSTPQMDLTIGTAICWSMQGAVLVEYTVQSYSAANGTPAYSSGQIGASVAYSL
jgi:hypothetical protein